MKRTDRKGKRRRRRVPVEFERVFLLCSATRGGAERCYDGSGD